MKRVISLMLIATYAAQTLAQDAALQYSVPQKKQQSSENTEQSHGVIDKASPPKNIELANNSAAKTATAKVKIVRDKPLTSNKAQSNEQKPVNANTNKNDNFIPSEEISEDLAVSFPVDI
jgi:archaellum component FlaG (FlaF/FlaG flagellin family)